jgi:hypothetical protein
VINASRANNIRIQGRAQKLRWQRVRNAAVRDENNDYYKIRAMLPANFPGTDDVISAIFEDLCSNALNREDIKPRTIARYIAAYNRMYPTKYAKFGDRPLLSLDAQLFKDGTATLGDTISHGLWD